MKKLFLFVAITSAFFLSCDSDSTDDEADVFESSWVYNDQYWEKSGNEIHYLGMTSNQAAWIDKTLPKDVQVEFKWKAESDGNEIYEFNLFLFGSKLTDGDFWNEGLFINYLVDPTVSPAYTVSWLRSKGIGSDGIHHQTLNNLPLFEANIFHDVKVVYQNNQISLYVDGTAICENTPVEIDDYTGYFGVTNYEDKHFNFIIKEVKITEL